jgi:LysR family transcriptional regulator for metE and metH
MYLEFRHLRTIRAIHEAGGLARAADMLHITQSALSHQVKALEEQVGMEPNGSCPRWPRSRRNSAR